MLPHLFRNEYVECAAKVSFGGTTRVEDDDETAAADSNASAAAIVVCPSYFAAADAADAASATQQSTVESCRTARRSLVSTTGQLAGCVRSSLLSLSHSRVYQFLLFEPSAPLRC